MRAKILFLVLIFFCSCGSKRADDSGNSDSVLEIDLLSESGSSVQKLSEFAANIEYIPLQTTKSSLLGSIKRKIVYTDNRIFIQNTDEVLCFDMDGKFLFKLKNTGRGPEEYTSIYDFDVSSDNKNLILLTQKRFLVYGISDTAFTFQRSITLKDPAPHSVNLVPESNKTFMAIPPWTGTEPTLSLLMNSTGDTIHFKPNCYKYKMVRNANFRALNEMLVYSNGNMVCFKEKFSDTVFYVNAKDIFLKPRMIFDSHGTNVTPEIRGGSETGEKNTTFVAYIFETSRYVFYWYFTNETLNGILFDKATKTKYKLDTDSELKVKIKDDLSGGPDFNIEFLNNYNSGDKLFSFVEAITLKKYIAGEDFKNAKVRDQKMKDDLKKLADFLTITDNPVLIILTPKE
jgi:hypothetical protein